MLLFVFAQMTRTNVHACTLLTPSPKRPVNVKRGTSEYVDGLLLAATAAYKIIATFIETICGNVL